MSDSAPQPATGTPTGRRQIGEARALMVALMARPDGMTNKDAQVALGDDTITVTCGRVGQLVARGIAYKVRRGTEVWHYFTTQAAADAWLDRVGGRDYQARTEPNRRQNITIKRGQALAPRAAAGPVRETIDTTWRPTARWQMLTLAPDPRWPAFASARPGVNPDTGKAWEARA